MTTADLNESVRRLASTLEVIRAEVGRSSEPHGASGLSKKLTEGAGMTKAFARELSEASPTGIDELTFRLFTLRQGEILFTALSKVLDEVVNIKTRLEALEQK